MQRKLLEILVCPVCKGKLLYDHQGQELICRFDKLVFPIHEHIPLMLIDQARDLLEKKRDVDCSF